jgi:hypothetical protein
MIGKEDELGLYQTRIPILGRKITPQQWDGILLNL